MEHEGDGDTNCNLCTRNNPQILVKGVENLEIRGKVENTIIKIGQNTEKSPGDSSRLTVAQTPVRNYQLTLVWKTLKIVK